MLSVLNGKNSLCIVNKMLSVLDGKNCWLKRAGKREREKGKLSFKNLFCCSYSSIMVHCTLSLVANSESLARITKHTKFQACIFIYGDVMGLWLTMRSKM